MNIQISLEIIQQCPQGIIVVEPLPQLWDNNGLVLTRRAINGFDSPDFHAYSLLETLTVWQNQESHA